MPIPDFQTVMLPVLKVISDGAEHKVSEMIDAISDEYNLSEEERSMPLPSGQQPIIDNRVTWARTYLKKAGLVEDPRRGYCKITSKGLEILKRDPSRIDIKYLDQFPEFREFRNIKKDISDTLIGNTKDIFKPDFLTPDEYMDKGFDFIQENLSQDLLYRIRKNSPSFFENVVLQLLSAMGYGKGEVTGQSGDGGIDGIMTQDKLGLDTVYVQAKRFAEDNPVTAAQLRDFVGTLTLNGVSKGVFITTSKFPKDSEREVKRIHKNIVLIDGIKLAELMIEHNVGVSTEKTYNVKRIDSDFFPEE